MYVFMLRYTQIQQMVFKEDRMGKLETLITGKRWNVCSYFKKPQLDPFLKIATITMNQFGNKLNSCPILQVFTYMQYKKMNKVRIFCISERI